MHVKYTQSKQHDKSVRNKNSSKLLYAATKPIIFIIMGIFTENSTCKTITIHIKIYICEPYICISLNDIYENNTRI